MISKEQQVSLADKMPVFFTGTVAAFCCDLAGDFDGSQYIRDLTKHCLQAKRKPDFEIKKQRLKVAMAIKTR